MEKCIYDTVQVNKLFSLLQDIYCQSPAQHHSVCFLQAAQGLDPNVIPADRGGFPSGGGNLPSFSLIAVRKSSQPVVTSDVHDNSQ
jgi:hypothetical protein